MRPALEARDVEKRYGTVVALDRVSLSAAAGECVALVGESGSGKTTLLRMFNRMVEPDAGEVALGGAPVRKFEPEMLRRRIGYVPQTGGLMPHWSVMRNAELVPQLLGSATASEDGARALEMVGMPARTFGARWPHELSGGQRQRVAFARALASSPAFVLLDEPFGSLDAISRADLHTMFLGVRRSLRLTCVLVTHDLREAGRLADRVAVLRAGKLEQVAPFDQLVAEPATPYVRELLARSLDGSAPP